MYDQRVSRPRRPRGWISGPPARRGLAHSCRCHAVTRGRTWASSVTASEVVTMTSASGLGMIRQPVEVHVEQVGEAGPFVSARIG